MQSQEVIQYSRVSHDLIDIRSLRRIMLEHAEYQLFQIIAIFV